MSSLNKGLYIQLFSIHGLIRTQKPELGKDADTGGQIKYVLELAKALSERDDVEQVDLVTRLIDDKAVDPDYGKIIEPISKKARIVRIQCGGRKYVRKELLWPHLEQFINKTIRFIKSGGRVPDLFHGHYADGGYVAKELAATFGAPFIFTGHSLGRNKKAKLIDDGMSEAAINKQYKIENRIHIEEDIIAQADLIITSTKQEIEKQYGLYRNSNHNRFVVIPPGIDLDIFYPYYDPQLDQELITEEVKQTRFTLKNELHRFWGHPEKPFILALCRPDQRKNISGLIEAYGTNQELQAIANLVIFAGIRSNILVMEENEKEVLTNMLLQMDRYDLYGKMAIPKKHDFATEVPELYRLCAESKGVFVNPALIEPFGLTLIEASACGLPIVATNEGGPVDIVGNCQNGILIDVDKPELIGKAIMSLLVDKDKWNTYSNNGINGVRTYYSWQGHCEQTILKLQKFIPHILAPKDTLKTQKSQQKHPPFGKRLVGVDRLLVTDIDNTLIGDETSMIKLFDLLEENKAQIAWGVATGRSIELTLKVMTEYSIPMPDILICSVGTEIYYGPNLRIDKGWQQHISQHWQPEQIKEALNSLKFLTFQEAEGQRSHKISYYLEDKDDRLSIVNETLEFEGLQCRVVYSHGQFLDILPLKASKGKAIDYVRYKYEFSPRNVMVAGDSGNDEDMISGHSRGLVVKNYNGELEHLKNKANIFFSEKEYAAGIVDGLKHYGLL